MKLVITARARRQIDKAREWWLRNRDKAPEAFDEDVERATAFILENPFAAPRVSRRRAIRRVKIDRIRYYLYFEVRPRQITILAFWHTSRRPPVL